MYFVFWTYSIWIFGPFYDVFPFICLDAPGGEGNGSEQTASTADELDVFGPMVSNPLSPSKAQQGQVEISHSPSSHSSYLNQTWNCSCLV